MFLLRRCFQIFAGVLAVAPACVSYAAIPAGELIYNQQCARCHGPAGQGTKKAPQPVVGDRSLPQLMRVVKDTMPESDPGSLTDDQTRDVTAYIFDAFYSPEAQARVNPPRVDLARLTVRQYRNAVADLVGSFRPSIPADARRGLRAEYFTGRDFRTERRLIDRVDPELQFDFGNDAPKGATKGEFDNQQFAIRWEGSVLAPETGVYDFMVRSDQAVRLWINNLQTPLVDALIKSGSDTDFRGSIYLVGGRSYSVRLEFIKGRQLGVAARQKQLPPAPAFVSLHWKAPHRVEEIIPSRFLSGGRSPEVFAAQTPFPPDDRSYGWERGTTISKEWVAATTNGALETAGYIAAKLPELSGTKVDAPDRDRKLKAFCHAFTARAFRRPLSDAEKKIFVDSQFEAVADLELAVKRVVLLTLKSPHFLYPGVVDGPEPYEAASRLSFTLWDAPPDKALLDAAATGKLSSRDHIRQQAERMIADPRAKAKVRDFLMAWLHVDHWPELVKDTRRFPGFDARLAVDLRTSLELFIDDVIWSESSDVRHLFTSEDAYLNGRLSAFYDAGLAADADFQKTRFDAAHRAGIVTHPYLLSVFAYSGETSPIHRGVFMGRGVLGVSLRPPNEAFTPLPPDNHPNLTTRQRVTLQTKGESCVGCHGVINPLGFALENFDAVGRHREKDAGKAIDVTGFYETRAGAIARFVGGKQLATFLAGSEDVHRSFATQLFQHMVKQPVRAYGLQKPTELTQTFARQGYSVRKLLVETAIIATTETVRNP